MSDQKELLREVKSALCGIMCVHSAYDFSDLLAKIDSHLDSPEYELVGHVISIQEKDCEATIKFEPLANGIAPFGTLSKLYTAPPAIKPLGDNGFKTSELKAALRECGFSIAWVGKCKDTGGHCKHSSLVCCSCGKPATHECSETGSFVCGAPLCDECEHTVFENGTNGGIGFDAQHPPEGMGTHCKKSDQKHKPWLERD